MEGLPGIAVWGLVDPQPEPIGAEDRVGVAPAWPELLRPLLLSLAKNKERDDLLFGKHWRDWPRKWVQRICREAEVEVVTAHGMRGLHATLAERQGVTAHAVVRALGHESIRTTREHYTESSAVVDARQSRVLKVIEGGRKKVAGGNND